MTDRKTLNLRSPSEDDAPPEIKKKGRGWEISEKRLDALHDRARDMRRHSTEAHKALAARFAKADLGRFKFTRHMVVGSAIVDFGNHVLGMAIVLDEGDQPEAIAKRSDKALEAVGIRVMRVKAVDVLDDIENVLARITAGMKMRMGDKRERRFAHEDEKRRSREDRGSDYRT